MVFKNNSRWQAIAALLIFFFLTVVDKIRPLLAKAIGKISKVATIKWIRTIYLIAS